VGPSGARCLGGVRWKDLTVFTGTLALEAPVLTLKRSFFNHLKPVGPSGARCLGGVRWKDPTIFTGTLALEASVLTLGKSFFLNVHIKTAGPLRRALPRRRPLEGPHGFYRYSDMGCTCLDTLSKPSGPSGARCLGGGRRWGLAVLQVHVH